MRILIDADGCPVVNETIKVAHKFNLESIIFCDTSHNFDEKNIKVIVVSKGIDAVDFAILNNIEKGDIVITQDYGLASLVLSRNSYAINQSGMVYTNENIDEFRSRLNNVTTLSDEDIIPKVSIDMGLLLSQINYELIDQIALLEPYGKVIILTSS